MNTTRKMKNYFWSREKIFNKIYKILIQKIITIKIILSSKISNHEVQNNNLISDEHNSTFIVHL